MPLTLTRSPSSSLHSSLSSANQFSSRFFLFWLTTRRDNSKDSKALSFPLVNNVPKYCNSGGVCPACTGTLCSIRDTKIDVERNIENIRKIGYIIFLFSFSFFLFKDTVYINELTDDIQCKNLSQLQIMHFYNDKAAWAPSMLEEAKINDTNIIYITWNFATVSGVRRMPCGDSAASSAASLYFVWENSSWNLWTTWRDKKM